MSVVSTVVDRRYGGATTIIGHPAEVRLLFNFLRRNF